MQQRKERAKERYQELILPIQAQSLLRKNVRQKVADLFKRRKVNKYWRFIPFLQMPIWLSLMEGLRAMCGNDKSLISYLLTSSSTTPEQSITSVLEPSLATEGALWFPDLLAGDPTGVLPITLGLSILLNVSTGWRTPSFGEISDYPRNEMLQHLTFRLLKGGMQTLAIYIGLSAYLTGMPAGLMIYWITSTNIATLQSLFLDKYMFAIKPLKPWTKMYVGILRPGEVKPPSKTDREHTLPGPAFNSSAWASLHASEKVGHAYISCLTAGRATLSPEAFAGLSHVVLSGDILGGTKEQKFSLLRRSRVGLSLVVGGVNWNTPRTCSVASAFLNPSFHSMSRHFMPERSSSSATPHR
ncbi:hypothetical protein T310_4449 [Rasamsonia emersonii CBS 393.64]|uniref:Membrane insertase YidC/Oxa/ALB C-terminal domain-containing protein n=1 Tax=Rasamsonia emersonii (strain ATCC 16479 / CBS 393.64 / IMI 116815) TaxID=1408163 RepID=A0A0F4YUF8_RASE3|nr:hypothetical protein T310_4449 [Rasamsonia emersonii CBS 393.64]KKA21491.1 hypothetical protein T310_4449 [Rasamsonia emersonii CBS 393.64]